MEASSGVTYLCANAFENFQLVVPYVNTNDNDADFLFFTKPHVPKPFYEMRDRIMSIAPGAQTLDGSSCAGCGGALGGGTPTGTAPGPAPQQ